MKEIIFIIPIILLLLCHSAQSNVLTLSTSNFSSFSSQVDNITVVMFYAPWCKFSQSFLPIFEELALDLSSYPNIALAKVDCVENKEIYWSEKIESTAGFPHIKMYVNGGSPISYNDEREKIILYKNIIKLYEKSIHDLDITEGGINSFKSKFLTKMKPIVILFHNKNEDLNKNIITNFQYACKKMDILECGISSDFPTLQSMMMNSDSVTSSDSHASIVIIRNFTGDSPIEVAPTHSYLDTNGGDSLYRWININAYPSLVYFEEANGDHIFSDKRIGYQTHVLIILDSLSDNYEPLLTSIHKGIVATTRLRGECLFAYIDSNDNSKYIKDILDSLKVDLQKVILPTAVTVMSLKTKINFYYINPDVTLESNTLIPWVANILDNKLKPNNTLSME